MRLLLDGHCIETAARHARARVEAWLLAAREDDPEASCQAAHLELLNEFLTRTDFAALRSSRAELDGSRRIAVELRREPGGAIGCHVEGEHPPR